MLNYQKIIVTFFFILTIMVSPSWSVEVGETIPDFSIQTFDGDIVSQQTLKGKPLLLVFWNTWCPYCLRELPKINQMADVFAPKGLAILAINTGINDTEDKARVYWKKHKLQYPTGFAASYDFLQPFGIRGVPTIFLFDSKGVVHYKYPLLPEDMDTRLRELTE